MIESGQSYCKESRVQFLWPTPYIRLLDIHTALLQLKK